MFRTVHIGNALPISFILDPSATFEAGVCAELTVIGNQICCTVSNGTAPIGIIDDYRTTAFTNNVWNEVVIVPAVGVLGPDGQLVTPVDIKTDLTKSNILPNSFVSTVNAVLNPVNGILTFPAGTPLNFDLTGSGQPNAIRTIVNYTYTIPNVPGDDSTAGSGRVTVWYQKMFFQTDQYETNQQYPIRANLYVNECGKFTTRRPSAIHPAVGMVTGSPSSLSPLLEAMWY